MFEQLSNLRNAIPSLRSFRNLSPIAKREMKQGFAFLSPWLIGFFAFTFLPILASLMFSFTDIKLTDNILNVPNFIGFDNWAQLFKDPQIWEFNSGTLGSLWITVK